MTYEMLVGKYPFEANTAWEWASKHMTEAPRPIETQALGANVPERMRAAITRSLAKKPEERFATVTEFYESLMTGASPHTVVMGAAPGHGPPAGFAAGPGYGEAAGAASGDRPRTEMAAPVISGGPPPHAMTPPYGAPGASPVSAGGPHVAIPAGPAHGTTGPEKKGGMGLVIGLGALAIVLIGGGIAAYALKGRPKTPTGDPLADLSASSSTSLAVPVETSSTAPDDSSATPLGSTTATGTGGSTVKVATVTSTTKATAGIPTPKPKPPDPPKVDPPICVDARNAAARKSPAAANLAAKCTAAGGKL